MRFDSWSAAIVPETTVPISIEERSAGASNEARAWRAEATILEVAGSTEMRRTGMTLPTVKSRERSEVNPSLHAESCQ